MGALGRPGDPAALVPALGQLLADPALRRRQGNAGRRRYLAGFTRERMARDTAAVYESVLCGALR
jgi:glycosyltransferase involved in cell wall biosynthesis